MSLILLERLGAVTNKTKCSECGHIWNYTIDLDDYGETHKFVNEVMTFFCPNCGHSVTKFDRDENYNPAWSWDDYKDKDDDKGDDDDVYIPDSSFFIRCDKCRSFSAKVEGFKTNYECPVCKNRILKFRGVTL